MKTQRVLNAAVVVALVGSILWMASAMDSATTMYVGLFLLTASAIATQATVVWMESREGYNRQWWALHYMIAGSLIFFGAVLWISHVIDWGKIWTAWGGISLLAPLYTYLLMENTQKEKAVNAIEPIES